MTLTGLGYYPPRRPCYGCGWFTCLCHTGALLTNFPISQTTRVTIQVAIVQSTGAYPTVVAEAPPPPLAVPCPVWPAGSERYRVGARRVVRRRVATRPVARPWASCRAAFARRLRQRYRRPSKRRAAR